jgi:hypothetical protein
MSNLSDFDLDLSYGKAGETLVEELSVHPLRRRPFLDLLEEYLHPS